MFLYSLTTPLDTVKGVGPKLSAALAERGLLTVKDALLFVPLRYEDRSLKKTINQLEINELVTLEVEVLKSSNFYKGRRSIQSASVRDETGKLKLMWFNNPHVITRLVEGKKFLISGKLNDRNVMVQPTIETLSDDSIHTGRLVPIYSMIENVPPATFRKILKEIVDNLQDIAENLPLGDGQNHQSALALKTALLQIHFPDSEDHIVQARERFALEELLALIERSQELKKEWQSAGESVLLKNSTSRERTFPFELTGAQKRCITEILADLQSNIPMNRLLIGDVGSGKTAVAGVASQLVLANCFNVALVAPTQILAEQHMATFTKLFPDLSTQLITSKNSKEFQTAADHTTPHIYIGTHAVLNQLEKIQPALIIYDEQHRFGVRHRSLAQQLKPRPHILTLSATPIPRTLILTLFSHLSLSVIDEMPPGRKLVKTWLVPQEKKSDGLTWIAQEIAKNSSQALIVCPFIDPSEAEALENVAAVTETFAKIKTFYKTAAPQLRLEILHGRMTKKAQQEITDKLYKREIDVLVTTPIIEVGVDLPAASIIVIEAAERFGLASLHQLRGRVGRAGQHAYCLLFTFSRATATRERLKKFCEIHEGMKLSEMDLQNRGAGDIFGTQQHGFDDLQFASWTNLELIARAKKIADHIAANHIHWQPFLKAGNRNIKNPLAN